MESRFFANFPVHLLGCLLNCLLCQLVWGQQTPDAELISALDLDAPNMGKVKAAVQAGDLKIIQQAYLDYRRTGCPSRWTLMPSDQPVAAVAKDDPLGDDVAAHTIHNFWYETPPKIARLGPQINWYAHLLPADDPGYLSRYWVSCVMARTHFWAQLANAYWKTRDEKYARAWVDQLYDFAARVPMDRNPDERVNLYWNPLSAAIRMHDTWPYAYVHFRDSPSFTPKAQWIYSQQVRSHALVLLDGLKDPKRTGNWITAEASGLYTLATLFPEFRESSTWRQIALDRLTLELSRLVPPDGFEAELSPGYHVSTVEQFTIPVELAAVNHTPLPETFRTRLIAMYRALVMVMDQSGNDVCTNDSWNINAMTLAQRGLKLGDDPILAWAASGGRQGIAPPASTVLPYAGFYAMRSGWKRDDLFLLFRGGPSGIGHVHEDALNVVLRAWNKTQLFDPGTYPYDNSPWRRYVLGTPAHSTIIVDGKWQHRGDSPLPVSPVSNPWSTTPLFDYVAATYNSGYQTNVYVPTEYAPMKWEGTLDKSILHTRRVLFLKPYYALILDTLDGTGNHTFDALFQVDAPGASIIPATRTVVSQRTDEVQLALHPLELDHLAVDVLQGQKDPLQGWFPIQHRSTPTVRFRKQQDAPAIFATFLYPYRGQTTPAFRAEPLSVIGKDLWARSLITPRETIEIALVKDNTIRAMIIPSRLTRPLAVEASGWIIRQPTGQTQSWQGGWGVRSFNDGTVAGTLAKPGAFLMGRSSQGILVHNGSDDLLKLNLSLPWVREVKLAPHAWMEITAQGQQEIVAPTLIPPAQSIDQVERN